MRLGLPWVLFSVLWLCLLLDSVECESRRPLLRLQNGSEGTGCYFVVLGEKATEEEMLQTMNTVSKLADDSKIYSQVHNVVKAFTVKLSSYSLEIVRRLPAVDYIEEEGFAKGTQLDPKWHLDRLDQLGPQLDHLPYVPIGDGSGVDVYVMDTGINYDHEEFEYRAKYSGKDAIDDENQLRLRFEEPLQFGRDCNGHGTHVSSLCGGKTYGSAKNVRLHSVRVLSCNNAGPWSAVLEGMDFVEMLVRKTKRPTIISMSLSGDHYQVVDDAITYVIGKGIHVIVAAGNGMEDSCSRSPASNPRVISVGGIRQGDGLYLLGSGTNFGNCVDIFAPGERVRAADWICRNCSTVYSGTSMATPLVSGLAAIMLSRQPLLSPQSLKRKLIAESIKDAIDFTGMPDEYKSTTSNRLATVQGSCGFSNSKDGSGVFSSPNYPKSYPSHLDCRWKIGGEMGIIVTMNISFLDLEPIHDMLRVYDGSCANRLAMIRNLTGTLGSTSLTFTSTGTLLCIRLTTDGTIGRSGFNATFQKFYSGTNFLKVPTPLRPKLSVGVVDIQSHILIPPRQARDDIENLMERGYKLTWISSYRVGPGRSPYFDFVASNSSAVDTVSFVDVEATVLNQTIRTMQGRGYYVKLLIDRSRGKRPEPSYSVIFEPRNEIFETLVYLRDRYASYQTRLAAKIREGFHLISHSFCSIRGTMEVSSVFIRDRRIPLNIPAPVYPRWQTRSNLTFFQFTDKTLKMASKNYVPSSVEVYMVTDVSTSLFTVTYTKRTEATNGNWFRWSLNTTAVQNLAERETKRSWDVFITTGYTYLGKTEHFIEFTRKRHN